MVVRMAIILKQFFIALPRMIKCFHYLHLHDNMIVRIRDKKL